MNVPFDKPRYFIDNGKSLFDSEYFCLTYDYQANAGNATIIESLNVVA